MSQEVMVHGHMSLLSHQESGKEKVCHNTSNNGKKFLVGMVTADHNMVACLPMGQHVQLYAVVCHLVGQRTYTWHLCTRSWLT